MTKVDNNSVLFYEGFCNLCSGLVQFVMARDHAGRVSDVPLQAPRTAKTSTGLLCKGKGLILRLPFKVRLLGSSPSRLTTLFNDICVSSFPAHTSVTIPS